MTPTTYNDRQVYITAGVSRLTTGGQYQQVFGVFATEADANSEDADNLALAIVTADQLTPEQVATARQNIETI